jgi:hypothetical protein
LINCSVNSFNFVCSCVMNIADQVEQLEPLPV